MLDETTRVKIADELVTAGETKVPVPLLTKRYPDMEIADSYAVQRIWRQRGEEKGRVVAGHKIGLTSKAMQYATGISEPDYGVIFKDMVLESGSTLEWDIYTKPRVEMELAFKLKEDVSGPDADIFDVLRATEYVVPALEILDARVEMEGRTIVDTIADNAAMGVMVVGGRPVRPDDHDLRWLGGLLYKNQEIEETGLGGGVLGHPANGVHWLANRLHEHDEVLRAGQIILAGSFTRPMWVDKGDTVMADYGPLGVVTCQFV